MREHYLKSKFDLLKVKLLEQDADPLTKNLPEKDHKRHAENYRNGTPFVYKTGRASFNRLTTKSKLHTRHRGRMSRWLDALAGG